MFEGVRRLLT